MTKDKNQTRDEILTRLKELAPKIARLSASAPLGPNNHGMEISWDVLNEGYEAHKETIKLLDDLLRVSA